MHDETSTQKADEKSLTTARLENTLNEEDTLFLTCKEKGTNRGGGNDILRKDDNNTRDGK